MRTGAWVCWVALAACRTAGQDGGPPTDDGPPLPVDPTVPTPDAELPSESELAPPTPTEELADPVVVVTDPAVLGGLQRVGFGEVVLGEAATSTEDLSDHDAFTSITDVLKRDLKRDAKADSKAGVGMRHAHRQFDMRWLDRDNVRLELVAVVNRLDRHPFAHEHCGETRLIYRLAYDATLGSTTVHSRLPMTFNVVFWQDGASCQEVAQRWMAPTGLGGVTLGAWLQGDGGPLGGERLARSQLKSVEVDMQSVRWPATVRPSMAGHAEYILRVFEPSGDTFAPAPLENTPDVTALKKSKELRAELLAWMREPANLEAIDEGTVVVPEKFLAKRGTSITPRGFARLGNRPFSQIYAPADFEDLHFDGRHHAKSAAGLLRRLDGLTCGGCHESRSVAGFHIVGEEPPDRVIDAVAVPISPHLSGDLARRRAYVRALADGDHGDDARPLSEMDARPGTYGSHCGLGDVGFAAWTCAEGLQCMAMEDTEMGVCVPKDVGAGDPCEIGTMKPHADSHRDRVTKSKLSACGRGEVCNDNGVGFPGGMCTGTCFGKGEGEGCGAIVALHPFNMCVGKRRPFPECVLENANPAAMRACDEENTCRDDYICARSPHDKGGVCLPPYFLFQLRVDGHVM